MRGTASAVATAFPVLAAVALAVVLVAAAAIAAVPLCRRCTVLRSCHHCHCRPCHHHCRDIQSPSPRCPRSGPCSCRCRVAPALTAVVAATSHLSWPLLPLPPPPLLPRNPPPCRRHCHDTPLLLPRCPCSSPPRCHLCHCRVAPNLADSAVEADLLVD